MACKTDHFSLSMKDVYISNIIINITAISVFILCMLILPCFFGNGKGIVEFFILSIIILIIQLIVNLWEKHQSGSDILVDVGQDGLIVVTDDSGIPSAVFLSWDEVHLIIIPKGWCEYRFYVKPYLGNIIAIKFHFLAWSFYKSGFRKAASYFSGGKTITQRISSRVII